MIQGCCYSGTEPHQEQHHPPASSSSTAAKRTAPGSLSHRAAELARVQPLQGDPFLSAQIVSSSSIGIWEAGIISISTAASKPHQRAQIEVSRPHFHRSTESHFERGDCTVFSICRLLWHGVGLKEWLYVGKVSDTFSPGLRWARWWEKGYSVAWLNEVWVPRQREFTGNGYNQLFRCAARCTGPCVSVCMRVSPCARVWETDRNTECACSRVLPIRCGFVNTTAPFLKCRHAEFVLSDSQSKRWQFRYSTEQQSRIGCGSATLAVLSCCAPVLAHPLHLHQHYGSLMMPRGPPEIQGGIDLSDARLLSPRAGPG